MGKREQSEAEAELQLERKARGKLREGYLEAGRQRAKDESHDHSEATRAPAGQETTLNAMLGSPGGRTEGRSAQPDEGSDESFESD